MNNQTLDNVARSVQILMARARVVQKSEREQIVKRAKRTVEILEEMNLSYDEAYEDAEKAERLAFADQPYELSYNGSSELFARAGLPSLISSDPVIIEARRITGIALYAMFAEEAKKIAERRNK